MFIVYAWRIQKYIHINITIDYIITLSVALRMGRSIVRVIYCMCISDTLFSGVNWPIFDGSILCKTFSFYTESSFFFYTDNELNPSMTYSYTYIHFVKFYCCNMAAFLPPYCSSQIYFKLYLLLEICTLFRSVSKCFYFQFLGVHKTIRLSFCTTSNTISFTLIEEV